MNNLVAGILAFFLSVALVVFAWVWMHNTLVANEEATRAAWAQVESNLQRRADLVPALIQTVARYLDYEAETFQSVTQTRGGNLNDAINALVDAQSSAAALRTQHGEQIINDESALSALDGAERALAQRMATFMAVAEGYPELRSSDQFLQLQAQLEGTENRINVTRMRFNATVQKYNSSIRTIPTSLVARVDDFQRKAYFKAEPDATEVPQLSFQ